MPPEYMPIVWPAESVGHYTASAAITAGRLLAVSGVGTLAHAGANALNVVGVAAADAAIGDTVTYFPIGVHEILSVGLVTAGDIVVAAATGKVSTLAVVTTPTPADVTNTRAIVGVALTTATDAAVQIQLKL